MIMMLPQILMLKLVLTSFNMRIWKRCELFSQLFNQVSLFKLTNLLFKASHEYVKAFKSTVV